MRFPCWLGLAGKAAAELGTPRICVSAGVRLAPLAVLALVGLLLRESHGFPELSQGGHIELLARVPLLPAPCEHHVRRNWVLHRLYLLRHLRGLLLGHALRVLLEQLHLFLHLSKLLFLLELLLLTLQLLLPLDLGLLLLLLLLLLPLDLGLLLALDLGLLLPLDLGLLLSVNILLLHLYMLVLFHNCAKYGYILQSNSPWLCCMLISDPIKNCCLDGSR